jgi:predicted nucleic acid-binding protein
LSPCVVVDASVALKWVLEEPYTSEATALLAEWEERGVEILVPALLSYEVSNALFKRVRRGELTIEEAKEGLEAVLVALPAPADEPHEVIYARALELAHRFGRPASYDAHYLALAELEGCELWTADETLRNAVKEDISWVRWIGEFSSPEQRG